MHRCLAMDPNFERLNNYVARRLRYYQAIGDLDPEDLPIAEVVDETYLDAAKERRPPGQAAYPWLRQIANRVLAHKLRRIGKAKRPTDRELQRALPELVPDPTGPVPDEVAETDELQRAMARILGELPDELREPFLLVVGDGHGFEDVAELEGTSREEALRRVATAGLILRRRLAREYGMDEALPLEQLFAAVERVEPLVEPAAPPSA
jgi:DNA-directed RNA polymerase specialized sigma24 family protein